MLDERPPICPVCGVTMVPATLSAREASAGDWVCLECEETDGGEGPTGPASGRAAGSRAW